tara:strand:- start:760 stop:1185 length:426 start_codon:yes stop_codon:yes gene_type:complete
MYLFNIIGLIRKVPFLIVIFYFGCIPVSHIIVGETREPVDPSSVELYLDYPQEYEKIALIDAGSNFAFKDPAFLFDWQSKMDKATERLKIEAAKLGANGVLIINTDNKIYQSINSDGEGSISSSSHAEKLVKAIAIYVVKN